MFIATIEEYDRFKKKGLSFQTKCCRCGKIIDEKFFARVRFRLVNKTLYCKSCAVQKVWDKRRDLDNIGIASFNDKMFKICNSILFNQKGMPVRESILDLKCENCGKQFSRTVKNLKNGIKKYDKVLCATCAHSMVIKEYNKSLKGMTAEDRFGAEKGLQFRMKMSEVTSGKKNPRFGAEVSNETRTKISDALTGVTLEERYGKDKADEIKHQMSLKLSGEKNPMFGKPSPTGSGNGWSGWYNGFYFRSLLELGFLLEHNDVKTAESIKIPYIDWNNNKRTYHPDFIMNDNINN